MLHKPERDFHDASDAGQQQAESIGTDALA